MTTIAKNTLANLLLVAILLCVGFGTFLLGAEPVVAVTAAVLAGVAIKLDDHRIRRARRKA